MIQVPCAELLRNYGTELLTVFFVGSFAGGVVSYFLFRFTLNKAEEVDEVNPGGEDAEGAEGSGEPSSRVPNGSGEVDPTSSREARS